MKAPRLGAQPVTAGVKDGLEDSAPTRLGAEPDEPPIYDVRKWAEGLFVRPSGFGTIRRRDIARPVAPSSTSRRRNRALTAPGRSPSAASTPSGPIPIPALLLRTTFKTALGPDLGFARCYCEQPTRVGPRRRVLGTDSVSGRLDFAEEALAARMAFRALSSLSSPEGLSAKHRSHIAVDPVFSIQSHPWLCWALPGHPRYYEENSGDFCVGVVPSSLLFGSTAHGRNPTC